MLTKRSNANSPLSKSFLAELMVRYGDPNVGAHHGGLRIHRRWPKDGRLESFLLAVAAHFGIFSNLTALGSSL